MMRCDEVQPRLEAYIDGELVEDEQVRLLEHLADCPECGPEAAAFARLRDGIRQAAPVYRAPEALRAQIRAALRAEAHSERACDNAHAWLARLCRLDPRGRCRRFRRHVADHRRTGSRTPSSAR